MKPKRGPQLPLTVENTEKDALIRVLLDALLEAHDLITCGWIEPALLRQNLRVNENALRMAKESGWIKSADWPKFETKAK